jgi:hypothetical protein
MLNDYKHLIKEIIEEQTNIVGQKVALNRVEATKVIKYHNGEINLLAPGEEALKKLILSFAEIFGDASTEVCEEVIRKHKFISAKSKNLR